MAGVNVVLSLVHGFFSNEMRLILKGDHKDRAYFILL